MYIHRSPMDLHCLVSHCSLRPIYFLSICIQNRRGVPGSKVLRGSTIFVYIYIHMYTDKKKYIYIYIHISIYLYICCNIYILLHTCICFPLIQQLPSNYSPRQKGVFVLGGCVCVHCICKNMVSKPLQHNYVHFS